jgi:hypothetical protein
MTKTKKITESTVLKLSVIRVIGGENALDSIMLTPLIIDWLVPKNCIWNKKEKCEASISRLYVLAEPLDGKHKVVGVCNEHHECFMGMKKKKKDVG